MALKFRLIERTMKIGKNAGKKLVYAQQVTGGKLSFEKLCDIIADGSTVSSADVKAVFDRLQRVFERYLADGYIIDCGELGSFRPSFGSKGVEQVTDFKQLKHLRKARVRYLPPRRFEALRVATYTRVNLFGEPIKEETTEAGGTPPIPAPGTGGTTPTPGNGGNGEGDNDF